MEFLSGMVNSISAYVWGEEDNDTTPSPEKRIKTPTSRSEKSPGSRGTRKRTKTYPESRKPSANSTRKSRKRSKTPTSRMSMKSKSRGKARTRKTRRY